jgi:16S rRNA (guanine(527)-N(7))-methyltransferase RsmG
MDRFDFIKTLRNESKIHSVDVSIRESIVLFEYYSELFEWNKRMNLISKSEEERFISRHMLDSLSIERCLTLDKDDTVLDMGSGNGLPGIPLAIRFPSNRISLIESNRKRCVFLNHLISKLHLTNVEVRCGRFEKVYKDIGTFSVIVVRGVNPSPNMIEMLKDCLMKAGKIVLYVGRRMIPLTEGTYYTGIEGRGFIVISKNTSE